MMEIKDDRIEWKDMECCVPNCEKDPEMAIHSEKFYICSKHMKAALSKALGI